MTTTPKNKKGSAFDPLTPRTGKRPTVPTISDKYTLILQNAALENFSKLNGKRIQKVQGTAITAKNSVLDIFTDEGRLKFATDHNTTTAIIENYTSGKPFTPDTAMLLDYIVLKHTQNGNKANDPTIRFSVKDYQEARGLKDPKTARESLRKNMDILYRTSLSFEGGQDKTATFFAKNEAEMRLFESKGLVNGQASIRLGSTFNKFITSPSIAQPMPYLKSLLKINTHKNPYTYPIGRKILSNKRINSGNKQRADYITMRTLLKVCTGLPTKEEVKASRSSYTKRIIEPILRDIGIITEIEVEYLTPDKSRVVSADELISMNYDDFVKLVVHVTDWKDYPAEMVEQWQKNGLDHKHKRKQS